MPDLPHSTESDDASMPRWVKLLGIATLGAILLVVILHLAGASPRHHPPGRHMPSGDGPPQHGPEQHGPGEQGLRQHGPAQHGSAQS